MNLSVPGADGVDPAAVPDLGEARRYANGRTSETE